MRSLLLVYFAVSLPAQAQRLAVFSDELTVLSARVSPAVVMIVSDGFQPAASTPGGTAVVLQESSGSGVVISADGYILTNAHVVAGSRRIQVYLSSLDPPGGRSIVRRRSPLQPARLIGLDRETDLALLKVDGEGLPFLPLADSDTVRQGQVAVAFGSPRGFENSVTMGIISAVGRLLDPEARVVYLQTDAAINPGNSGGPLVNLQGEVIGINTLIVSQSRGSEGLGFALPSNIARYVAEELKVHGRVTRGDIGVEAQTITPGLAAGLKLSVDHGVVLADVFPRGPADNAGLEVGDVVLAIDGKPMENARQFHVNVYQHHEASTIRLQILRGTGKIEKIVTVLDRGDGAAGLASLVTERLNLVPRLSVLALSLDPALIDRLPRLRRRYGIVVAKLTISAAGVSRDLEEGDVIYQIDGQPVSTLKELRDLLDAKGEGQSVVAQVERAGKLRYLELTVE